MQGCRWQVSWSQPLDEGRVAPGLHRRIGQCAHFVQPMIKHVSSVLIVVMIHVIVVRTLPLRCEENLGQTMWLGSSFLAYWTYVIVVAFGIGLTGYTSFTLFGPFRFSSFRSGDTAFLIVVRARQRTACSCSHMIVMPLANPNIGKWLHGTCTVSLREYVWNLMDSSHATIDRLGNCISTLSLQSYDRHYPDIYMCTELLSQFARMYMWLYRLYGINVCLDWNWDLHGILTPLGRDDL